MIYGILTMVCCASSTESIINRALNLFNTDHLTPIDLNYVIQCWDCGQLFGREIGHDSKIGRVGILNNFKVFTHNSRSPYMPSSHAISRIKARVSAFCLSCNTSAQYSKSDRKSTRLNSSHITSSY